MGKINRYVVKFIALVCILSVCLCGCMIEIRGLSEGDKSSEKFVEGDIVETDTEENDMIPSNIAYNQFLALTDTREEAELIAEDYGITLVSFSYGVAVFHTDETDLGAVISRGSGKYSIEYNYTNSIQN